MTTLDHASRRGTLTLENGTATLRFERRLQHPIEDVWNAITSPDHILRWAMSRAIIDGRPGGNVDFVTGPARVHATGRVLAWDPPRLFEHESKIEPGGYVSITDDSILRWELTPLSPRETLLRFTHTRVSPTMAIGVTPARHALLDRLEAELNHAPLPDLGKRMNEIGPLYADLRDRLNA